VQTAGPFDPEQNVLRRERTARSGKRNREAVDARQGFTGQVGSMKIRGMARLWFAGLLGLVTGCGTGRTLLIDQRTRPERRSIFDDRL
jgi:hypothetical protein